MVGGLVMTEKELIEFLRENLTIEVSHPEHNVGSYYIINKPDEHNITVKIKLLGRTICEDTSCS